MPYPDSTIIEAKLNDVWTDISDDVVSNLEVEVGMTDEAHDNRVAEPGILTFHLNNDAGTYTPGSTFKKGVFIKVTVSYGDLTRTKFYGTVNEADVDAGEWGEERVRVTCTDWLDYAVKQPVRGIPVDTNKRMDDGVEALIANVPIQPLSTLIDDGTSIFPTIFDDVDRNTTIYRELNNLVISEFGYAYMDRGGERLRVENNQARANATIAQLPGTEDGSILLLESGDALLLEDGSGGILLETTQDAVFTNAFDAIEDNPKIVHGKHILNEVEFIVYPKEVGTSNVTLFELQEPVLVPALGEIIIEGYFSDPTLGGHVSGTELVDPIVTTDYTMFANEDGTGTNLTTNLTITSEYYADRVKFTLSNSGVAGWVDFLRLRGHIIRAENPISVLRENQDSKEAYGVQSLQIRQIYQQEIDVASFESQNILDIEREPRNVLIRTDFTANSSDLMLNAFLHLDIGDLIRIVNTKPAIDSYYFIQGMRYSIGLNGIIYCTWLCKEQPTYVPIAIDFANVGGAENAIDFGIPGSVTNLDQISYSMWIYAHQGNDAVIMGKYSGTAQNLLYMSGLKLRYLKGYNISDGQWITTNDAITLSGWVHIGVTYDSNITSQDAKIYVGGIQQATTDESTPAGARDDDREIRFMFGNAAFPTIEWAYNPTYVMKDARVYNRVISSGEMLALAQNENVYDNIQNGLVFHAPFVRNFRYDDYVDNVLTTDMFVFDRLNEYAGVPHYDTTVSGYQIYGRDPSDTSY